MRPSTRTGIAATVLLSASLNACDSGTPNEPQPPAAPEPVATVAVSPGTAQVPVGGSQPFAVVVTGDQGSTLTNRAVTWATSDPAVAEVDAAGVVTTLREGSADVTATVEGVSGTAAVTATSQIAPTAVIVDSAATSFVSTSAERDAGVLKFVGTVPSVAVDDVLVGVENGGFLGRVTALETRGDTTVATTGPASLEDIVEAGTLDSSIPLNFDQAAPALVSGVQWGATEIRLAQGVQMRGGDIVFPDFDFDIGPGAAGTVGIRNGEVEIDGMLDLLGSYQLANGLTQFELGYTAEVTVNASLVVESLEGIEAEAEQVLLSASRTLDTDIGGVPMVGVATLEYVAGVEVDFDGPINLSLPASGVLDARLGATWNGASIAPISEGTATLEGELDTGDPADGTAYVRFGPRLSITLYGNSGPRIDVPLVIDASGQVVPERCEWEVGGAVAMERRISLLLGVFSSGISDIDFPTEVDEVDLVPVVGPYADTLFVSEGDAQVGRPGQALGGPLVVQVLDPNGQPAVGRTVIFEAVSGGGDVSSVTITDEAGVARAEWVLGGDLGIQTAEASLGSCGPSEPVVFTAQAVNLGVTTEELPGAFLNEAYSAELAFVGGSGEFSWSVVEGALPAGLELSSAGVITGTPTAEGTSEFTVQVESGGVAASQVLSIEVVERPFLILTETLPEAAVGNAYSQVLEAAGGPGNGAYVWSVTAGSLPTGMGLTGAGEIIGTPEVPGTSSFTVTVSRGAESASREFMLVVVSAPVEILEAALPGGQQNVEYEPAAIEARFGDGNYVWSLAEGRLPPGLRSDISGPTFGIIDVPREPGTFEFTLRAESGGQFAERSFSITIAPDLLALETPDTVVVEWADTVSFDMDDWLTGAEGADDLVYELETPGSPFRDRANFQWTRGESDFTVTPLRMTANTWPVELAIRRPFGPFLRDTVQVRVVEPDSVAAVTQVAGSWNMVSVGGREVGTCFSSPFLRSNGTRLFYRVLATQVQWTIAGGGGRAPWDRDDVVLRRAITPNQQALAVVGVSAEGGCPDTGGRYSVPGEFYQTIGGPTSFSLSPFTAGGITYTPRMTVVDGLLRITNLVLDSNPITGEPYLVDIVFARAPGS